MKKAVFIGVVATLHGLVAMVLLSPGCRTTPPRQTERQIAVMPEPVAVTPVPARAETRPPILPPIAPPVVPEAPPPPADAKEYVVLPGDVLSRIAQRAGVSVREIIAINRLIDPDRITVGQTLLLPAHARVEAVRERTAPAAPSPSVAAVALPGDTISYVVQTGDVLSRIAVQHGTTVAAILKANNMTNPDLIRVDQKLLIPAGAAPRSPAREPSPPRFDPAPRSVTPPPRVEPRDQPDETLFPRQPPALDEDVSILMEGSAGDITVLVGQGDTLEGIAMTYGLHPEELQRYNGLSSRRLNIGDVIRIPRN